MILSVSVMANISYYCNLDLSSRRTESEESLDSLGQSNDSDDDVTRDQVFHTDPH